MTQGLSLSEVAQSFFDQPETQALYVGSTNRDFIQQVYQNLFNRDPDTAGLEYWESELNSGQYSKNLFIQAVINGAQNNDAIILTNKTLVGLNFVDNDLFNLEVAKYVIENVDSTDASVQEAFAYIASVATIVDVPVTTFGQGVYTAYYTGAEAGMLEFGIMPDNSIHGFYVSATYEEYGSLSGTISSNGTFNGWTDDGSASATGSFIDFDTISAYWNENQDNGTFQANLVNTNIATLGQNGILEYANSLGLL